MTLKENSVLSAPPEASEPVQLSCKGKVKSENSVLSGPPIQGTSNPFACDAVHSKLGHTHNESNAASKRFYTDHRRNGKTEQRSSSQDGKQGKTSTVTEDQNGMTQGPPATKTREVSHPSHTPGKNPVPSGPKRTLEREQLDNPLSSKSNSNK